MDFKFELYNAFAALLRTLVILVFIIQGHFDVALGETTAPPKTAETKTQDDGNAGMIKGMAAGFGGFIGFIVLICVMWCCCCANDESSSKCCCKKEKPSDKTCPPGRKVPSSRSKIGPSPPQSAVSWSRSQ